MRINKIVLFAGFFLLGLALMFFYFKCKKEPPKPFDDSIIKEQTLKIAKLQHENDSLKSLKRLDSIKIVALNTNIGILQSHHTVLIEKIKELPSDKAIAYAQEFFMDTSKIVKLSVNENIRAAITFSQLTEHNISVTNEKYFGQLCDSLEKNIGILQNSGLLNETLIKNLESMVNSKDEINKELADQNNSLQSESELWQKKYKRQRAWKYIYKGFAAFMLGVAAVK